MKIGEYEQMMAYLTRPGFKDGTQKIVEPPKSMQVDTTTENPIPDYNIRDFRNDAEIYVLMLHNNTIPKGDIADKLNAFARKGVDAGTFSMQEAGDTVRRLIGEVKDRARHQRLRDVVPSGIGTIEREEFKYGTVPGEGNSRIEYDPETQIYRKRVQETIDGKKTSKLIYSEPGQSLEEFKKIKPVRSTEAIDATVKSRQFINDWTKNWFDNNLTNYGVRDFDVMINDLSKDWSEVLESGDVPKGTTQFKLSTPELGLPNVTSGRDAKMKKGAIEPFSYNNVKFYANLESSKEQIDKTLAQYKKIFYKNKIETNPNLRTELGRFFNFMAKDKRGLYRTSEGQTISKFMDTVSDDVKYLLNDEASGLKRSSKKEVFNAYEDLASNYNKYTQNKARLKAVQSVTEAKIKAGPETSGQTDELIKQIKDQNKLVAKMSPEELVKNKNFIKSLRLVINPQTGEVSFSGYTENDPKVKTKGVKSDLELARHAIERAKDPAKKGGLFSYDHISKRSFGKMNTQFPNNIQSANYITNTQLENARRFLEIPENRNTPAAQNLDKVLEDLNLTIRGTKEYGGTYGNKSNIVFDSKTNRSNIVDSQLFNTKRGGKIGATAVAASLIAPTISKADDKLAGEQPVEGTGEGLPYEAALPAGVAVGKYGPQILNALKNVGKVGLKTVGSVPAAGVFAGTTIKENLEEGKNIVDAIVDPLVGIELLLPETVKKLGPLMTKAARVSTPVGTTITGLGILKERAQNMIRNAEELAALEATPYQQDLIEDFAANQYRGYESGGRVNFADGPEDPSKRKFMKIVGGLASLPIVGRFFDVAERAAPLISKIKTPDAVGKPEWFDTLVNKVIQEGTDMTKQFATKDREIVHGTKISDDEYVRVVQDLDEDVVRIEYDSPTNVGQDTVVLQVKAGKMDEATGRKPRDEFEASEVEPAYTGGPEDTDMEFVGENSGRGLMFIESDVSNLKQFATGKKLTKEEAAKAKKRKEFVKKINEDQYEAAEHLAGKYGDGPDIDYDDLE